MAVITINYTIDGYSASGDSNVSATTVTLTPASITRITETVAIGTDAQVNCSIDTSALSFLVIYASSDCTLQANDGTSPDYTLTLTGGKPFVWYTGCGITNPITADTTEFFVTNAAECKLVIHVGQDSTP